MTCSSISSFCRSAVFRALTAASRVIESAGRPNGALTVDSWHLFLSGSTLEQLVGIAGERIFALQINDGPAKAQADPLAETMTARLLPGDGSFDLTGLVSTLDRIGSTAPIGTVAFSSALSLLPMDALAARALMRLAPA